MIIQIGTKVKYSKQFLQKLGSTFTEEEFKEFNAVGTIKHTKVINGKLLLCTVDFDGTEKKILSSNLIKYSENFKVFLERE